MTVYNGSIEALAPDLINAAYRSNGFVIELGVQTGNGSTPMFQEGLAMKTYSGGTGALAPDLIAAARDSNGLVVEMGVFAGNTTEMFQEALDDHPEPLHISVDWDDRNFPPENRPKTSWWHYIVGDTRSPLTVGQALQIANGRKAGVIFIDTDHNFECLSDELALWQVFADENTVWLGHDSYMYGPRNDDMMRAVEEFCVKHGWVYDDLRTDSHGLWRMVKAK